MSVVDGQHGEMDMTVDQRKDETLLALAAANPVKPEERVVAVDVLRGVALLGILAMNIVFFAWPSGGYENPIWSGGDTILNRTSWWFSTVLFSGKMMSLFSMLFGAGLVLMSERSAKSGASTLGVYYRRIFWLLCIGMLHAYLIWAGDILVMYAICGLVLYWFRKVSAGWLIGLGIVLLVIQSLLQCGFAMYGGWAYGVAQRVEANEAAGVDSLGWELGVREGWDEGMRSFLHPTADDIQTEVDRYTSGYLTIVSERAPEVLMFQIFGFFIFALWGAGGRMLIGMALMKMGVFSAERSWSFYKRMAAGFYAIGLPLTIYPAYVIAKVEFDTLQAPFASALLALGMVPMALGHAAVVMMVCKAGLWDWLRNRLAAVGRMALTNYLLQSVLCTTLFYGYGLGWFASVDRSGLWVIVIAIWVLQLWYSPIWLSRFRYGPAEWLWRSLTYWRWEKLVVAG